MKGPWKILGFGAAAVVGIGVISGVLVYVLWDYLHEDEYIAELSSGSWVKQSSAASRLGHIHSKKAVLPLTRLLRDGQSSVENEASQFAGLIGNATNRWLTIFSFVSAFTAKPKDRESLNELREMCTGLWTADTAVPSFALSALGEIGTESSEAIAAVVDRANDSNVTLRMFAAVTMGQLRSAPERTVPVLVVLLKDTSEPVRRNAAIALGRYGPAGRAALLALREVQEDSSDAAQRCAREAIEKIEGTRA